MCELIKMREYIYRLISCLTYTRGITQRDMDNGDDVAKIPL